MKFKTILPTALALILLSGCASMPSSMPSSKEIVRHSINGAIVAEALYGFKATIEEASERVVANSDVFTDKEWMNLMQIESILESVEKSMSHTFSGDASAKEILVSISIIDTHIEEMYLAYKLARSVYHSSSHRLSAGDKAFYLEADAAIEKAYVAYLELKDTDTGSDATKIITSLITALKLVVKVVTIVAPLVIL